MLYFRRNKEKKEVYAMQNEKRPLDMLHGPIWNKLPRFALPVAATAILEQLFNASDIAVVGNFTGAEKTAAVAAVGANSPVIGLIVNLFIGIALGANVVIAHAIGQKELDESVHKAVHTAVLVALLGGVAVAILGELAAAPLLGLLNVPDEVFPLALLYLRIYLLGMPVILLYNFEAAIFRSIGETKTPLLALTASGILNVALNLFFVAVLGMTVNGVAIATVHLQRGQRRPSSTAACARSGAGGSRRAARRCASIRASLKQHPAHRPARGRPERRVRRWRTSSSSRRSTAWARSSWRRRARRSISKIFTYDIRERVRPGLHDLRRAELTARAT